MRGERQRQAAPQRGPERILWDPIPGRVGGSRVAAAPLVSDPVFGRSRLCVPWVLAFRIAEGGRWGSDAGALVKERYFPNSPPFVFQVGFGAAERRRGAAGPFGDPGSIWFNVAQGSYEVAVRKREWGRPFGYASRNSRAEIRAEEMVRLLVGDFNYLAGYVYGVPEPCIARHDDPDLKGVALSRHPRLQIAGRLWDAVEAAHVRVVSMYESDAPGANRLVKTSPLTPLLRSAFGPSSPHPDHPQSFPPTALRSAAYVTFYEDVEHFRTLMVGGTANEVADSVRVSRFLEVQLGAARALIAARYAHLGFPVT